MKNLIAYLIVSVLGVASVVAASELPTRIKPARAAVPSSNSVSDYAGIESKLLAHGIVRVIVRLAPPAHLPGGFGTEAKLENKAAKDRQRADIELIQNRVLAKLSNKSGKSAKRFHFIPYMAIEVDLAGYQALIASPDVEYIEEDAAVPLLLAQSIPLIGGDPGGTFEGYTGDGQIVAILDAGVDKTHPFLADKVVGEACFSTTDGTATALCVNGSTAPGSGANCNPSVIPGAACLHGTHVAGIAAGKGTGGVNFNGVAKNANIISIQVFSQFSSSSCGVGTATCALSYTSDQISALQHIYSLKDTDLVTYNKIASVNMSLGGTGYIANCDSVNSSMKDAIDNLRADGIATIIAAGNSGLTNGISFPACITSAISVGATDKADVVDTYSNNASFLSLLAPGSDIVSSVPGGGYASSYSHLSPVGTSMAAAHVAGAWAVLKSAKPTAGVDEILDALASTGKSVVDGRNGSLIAKPRIQLDSAVKVLDATPDYTLTVTKGGVGSGTVTGSGNINCGSTCSASVYNGATATLIATADSSSFFTGWSGSGACAGTTNPCIFTITGNADVQANFITTTSVGTESFNGGAVPAGWSVSGTGPVWRFDDPKLRGNMTGGTGGFAIADSDYAGNVAMDTELRSPVYNFSAYTNAYLSFNTLFNKYNVEICDVDVSINGGSDWTNVWRKSGTDFGPAGGKLDISTVAAGQATVKVRFHYYNATSDWYWQVDDVSLFGAAPNISATVTGSNGTVSSTNPLVVNVGSTATFTLVPDPGYKPVSIVGGSCPAGSFTGNSYTTGSITSACSVVFSFIPVTYYAISTDTGGNGVISCTPSNQVDDQTPVSCTATPASGNYIVSVTVDGSAQTVNDTATFTYSFGAITADHRMNAVFTGKVTSSAILASSANPSVTGSAVTFTATITGRNPSGTVVFKDNLVQIGTAGLSNGRATFIANALSTGSHSITAHYSGDSSNGTSESFALQQTINENKGVSAVSGGMYHSLVLKNDTGVVAWGYTTADQTVPLAATSGVTAIAAGNSHSLALKSDGSLVAWGYNDSGQITVPLTGESGVTAIAAGYSHSVVLKIDGSVVAWGNNDYGQTTVPLSAGSGVIALAAGNGNNHTVALKNDGSVIAWGSNNYGQSTVPPSAASGVIAVAAGGYHTVALKNDGSVVAWGNNSSGQATIPSSAASGVIAIAAGVLHSVALKSDGSVIAWGSNSYGQRTVPSSAASGVIAIAAGGYHTIALKSDGSVVAWGYNNHGQAVVPYATVSLNPSGTVPVGQSVTITGDVGGINCVWNGTSQSGTCSSTGILTASKVVLTATLPDTTIISSWGSGCDSTSVTACVINSLTVNKAISPVTMASANPQAMTITLAGTGRGQVVSTPFGISCASGSSAGCSTAFINNPTVSLQQTAAWDSTFAGWSGGCTGGSSCSVSMSSPSAITATFNLKQNVNLVETQAKYSSLQTAYNAIQGPTVIQAGVSTFVEDLFFGSPTIVTLDGGYDSSFLTNAGYTTISGSLTIRDGTVKIGRITFR